MFSCFFNSCMFLKIFSQHLYVMRLIIRMMLNTNLKLIAVMLSTQKILFYSY